MTLDDLDTPSVIIDLDLMDKNIRDMADHCRQLGIPLRVHTKSHKIPEIAHRQIAAGAIGVACQKLGDAEVMVAAGIHDILIPYNIVGPKKTERLLRLAKRATMTVAVDSEDTAKGISDRAAQDGGEVNILIELDTGGRRCGVQSPEAACDLAKRIAGLPGLKFQGVMTYPSRPEAKDFFTKTVGQIRGAGIPVNVISGGGTGHEHMAKDLGLTETRSGSYVWEGLKRIGNSDQLHETRCPLRVLMTVVSVPAPDRAILDGGMKTFASYPPKPYGRIIEHLDAKIYGMSVEHGHVDTSACAHKFRVGERVSVIPLHQEMCLNLHDECYGYRNGKIEVIWPVAGRGKVR